MVAYDIKPEIEAFDLSHIVQATRKWLRMAGIRGKLYVQFVMGVKNAMPADEAVFRHLHRHAEAAQHPMRCGAQPALARTRSG
jgi:uncharacterized protein (DUF849 family)